MTTPTLTIKRSDGTIERTIDCDTAKYTSVDNEMDRVQVVVPRRRWDLGEVNPRLDRLLVDRPDTTRLFGGRLDEFNVAERGVIVSIVSFEKDALDAEPTPRDYSLENVTDEEAIKDAISAVPELSAGTIENLESDLTFEFSRHSPSKQMRKVAAATGGKLRFNADRTVDYKAGLGSDLELTVSGSNRNISGPVNVRVDDRNPVTHRSSSGSCPGRRTGSPRPRSR